MIPLMDWTTTIYWGFYRQQIMPDGWDEIQANYPFWGGLSGPKLLSNSVSAGQDDWLVFFNVLHEDIPTSDPENDYQYGFVFDRDGNTSNNYHNSSTNYANDFFDNTDFWVVANYYRGYGWQLTISDAVNGNVTAISSNAKMIIEGNTIMVFIPRSEFLSQNIGYRMTCFSHQGDWGLGGVWSGDVQPSVTDGLKWVDIGTE